MYQIAYAKIISNRTFERENYVSLPSNWQFSGLNSMLFRRSITTVPRSPGIRIRMRSGRVIRFGSLTIHGVKEPVELIHLILGALLAFSLMLGEVPGLGPRMPKGVTPRCAWRYLELNELHRHNSS